MVNRLDTLEGFWTLKLPDTLKLVGTKNYRKQYKIEKIDQVELVISITVGVVAGHLVKG